MSESRLKLESELGGDHQRILDELKASGAKKVALQFPEGLKRKAYLFADILRENGYSVIISGDACWGACDLDLSILSLADVLVHYGHAPVDDTPNVIYDYMRQDIELSGLEAVTEYITESKPAKIGLVTTIQHVHQLVKVSEFLKNLGIEAVIAEGSSRTVTAGQILGCSYAAARNTGCETILFVGTGVFHPLGVALATKAKVIAFDPFVKSCVVVNPDRLLRQRFAKIERAKSAKRYGIIVSKKSGQKREELAQHLLSLSDKGYIIYMNEITPDLLLNFQFDAYVNTSCPRLAYDDQSRYPVPMLSPQEYEIVLGVRDWEDYVIDEIL